VRQSGERVRDLYSKLVGTSAGSSPAERVAAVIVHFRTPDETERAAVAVAADAPGAEIVVVDNASGDGIARRLAERVPSARVLEERVNRGYGSACNRGARETRRPLLLFLNSDAYVLPGSVEALVRALDADEGAAAAGPRLLETDGGLQPSIPGCRRRGGSSARARASRFSRAAASPSRGTRRIAPTTAAPRRSRR